MHRSFYRPIVFSVSAHQVQTVKLGETHSHCESTHTYTGRPKQLGTGYKWKCDGQEVGGSWHHIRRQRCFTFLSPVSVRQKQTPKDPPPTRSSPREALWPLAIGCGFGLGRRVTAGLMQHSSSCQTAESCAGFSVDVDRSSRAWTVTPTFTRPRSSRMWWGRHSLSWVCTKTRFVRHSKILHWLSYLKYVNA